MKKESRFWDYFMKLYGWAIKIVVLILIVRIIQILFNGVAIGYIFFALLLLVLLYLARKIF